MKRNRTPTRRWTEAGEPLLERSHELRTLDARLKQAQEGSGGTVLIEGPAGMGKTRLLEAAASRARAAGMLVCRARAGPLERDMGWAIARELLVPVVEDRDERVGVLTGTARLAAPLLRPHVGVEAHDEDSGEGGDHAAAAFVHGLYWVVANLCEHNPVMLAVDDAHWSDAPSLRFLSYLANRAADLPLLLVVAARPKEGASRMEPLLAIAAQATVLRPAPLTEGAAAALLEHALGTRPGPGFASTCHEMTGGNPFLLHEMQLELAHHRLEPDEKGAAKIRSLRPAGISQAIEHRLREVPETASAIARSVAVLGDSTTVAHAARVAGMGEEGEEEAADAAERLARAGILAPDLPLCFVHPIVRSSVYEAIPAPTRSRLHRMAATVLAEHSAEPEQAAAHLLAAEPAGDPEAVDILHTAARRALAKGLPAEAVTFLRRALAEPPLGDRRADLLVALAEVAAVAGEPEAIDHLQEALELVVDPSERGRLHLKLGWMLCRSARTREGLDVLRRGWEELGDLDRELTRELETLYFANAWLEEQDGGRSQRWREEILKREQRSEPVVRAGLTQRIMARVLAGESAEEVVADATRLFGGGALLEEEGVDALTPWIAIGALSWADALDESERAIEMALDEARRRGSPVAIAHAYYSRSWPRYWRGQLQGAAADAEAAVAGWSESWELYLPAARYWHCRALLELGDVSLAEKALEQPGIEERWAGNAQLAQWRVGRGELLLGRGEVDAGLEELLAAGEILEERLGIHNPAAVDWRASAAIASLRAGHRSQARRLAEKDLERARRFGSRRTLGTALRVAGIVSGSEQGIELALQSIAVLERSPSRLELCRALIDLGVLLRAGRQPGEAREPLQRGLEMAHSFGAVVLERRAREELLATGARPRRSELTGTAALTPSQRRVVELVANGLSNRQVAQELFVTRRTVETHLTQAYSKLGISSRDELADVLIAEG